MKLNERPIPRWFVAGFWFAGVGSIFSLICMIAIAVDMVLSGRALETYRTFWLVEFNWVGFLAFAAISGVAALAGLVIRIRHNREWRHLQRKYGERADSDA